MRKLITILSFLFMPAIFPAQSSTQWQQIYGGTGVEVAYGIRTCLGQGYIVCGTSASAGPTDGYVFRLDTFGLVMWSRFYGGNNIDVIRAVELLPDSGFILAGYTNSYGFGGYDGWVLRLDKNGDTLWTKTAGTTDWDFFYDVEVTRDGGFICAGGTYGLGAGDEDMYLVRYDSNGDTLWTKTYGGPKTDEARGVIETEDSLLAICGYTNSFNDTLGDSWLLRLDLDGDTIWTHWLGDLNAEDRALGLHYDSITDRIVYVGYSMATGNGDGYWEGIYYNNTTWVRVNSTGVNYEEYASVRIKPGMIAAIATNGTTFTYGGGMGDMNFFTSAAWYYSSYGTVKEDHGYGVDFATNGGYILCGSTLGYNSLLENAYVIKLDTAHLTAPTVEVPEVTQEFSTSVWPVPASTELNISIASEVALSSNYSLTITDVSGRIVREVHQLEFQSSDGLHATAKVFISDLQNGIYFFTLEGDSGLPVSSQFLILQ